MEISNAHHQAMSAHQLEEVLAGISCPKNITIDHHQHQLQLQQQQQQQQEKKVRPIPEQALKCPRCDSTNTKFCYYNNYTLSQPRYFCKGCRRYWTQGGSLRNVPVGGGCRKNNKRSSNSKKAQENQQPPLAAASPHPQQLLPPLSYDPNDLSLAFASLHKQQPNALDSTFLNPNPNPNPASANFLDVLRGGGFVDHSTGTNQSGGFNSAAAYNYVEAGGGNMLFPFEGGDLNLGGATASAAATGEAAVLEGSWIGHGNNNVGVDTTRDYWNGVGSYWHGIINSSLM